jgi:hypothetical protein
MATASAERLQEQVVAFFRKERLPPSWRWYERLTPLSQRRCAVDLADALKKSFVTGRFEELEDLVDDWKATAEVEGSPEMQALLKRKNKKYVTLTPFKG